MGDRSNTTAERRHMSSLLVLHLWRVCHFRLTTIFSLDEITVEGLVRPFSVLRSYEGTLLGYSTC